MMAARGATDEVLCCGDLDLATAAALLGRYDLSLSMTGDDQPIPASYWGEPDAGLDGRTVWARRDTPVHSLLHEAAHVVCMDAERRAGLTRDAGGGDLEEAGVCYLQLILADQLTGVGRTRLATDMDAWGYSFRLGSMTRRFEEDANDAHAWLIEAGILDRDGHLTWRVRGDRRG